MERFSDVLQDRYGSAIAGGVITVRTAAGALATLYQDDGLTPLANPVTTGNDGEYGFYAANGKYTLTITAPGYRDEAPKSVLLYDPGDSGGTPTEGTVTSVNGDPGPAVTLDKADIGLGNVDNTSDEAKPISIATQAALDLKASQASVDLKAPLASPTFTGTPAAPTAAPGTNTTQIATTAFVAAAITGSFRGYGTIATRNALSSPVVGDIFVTNDPMAPNGYLGDRDIVWRYDGTNWTVLNGQAAVFQNRGLFGHTAGGWAAQNTEIIQPGCDLLLPAGLLAVDGDQLTIEVSMYKAGTGSNEAVEWRMRYGSDANGLLNPEIRPTWTLDHNAGAGTKARQVHQRWTYVRRSATTMTSVSKAMGDSNSAPYGSINNSADSQSPDMTDFTVPNLDSTATRLSLTIKQITDATTDEWWVVTRLRLTLEQ